MVFELKELGALGALIGRELSRADFLSLAGGSAVRSDGAAPLLAEIGCCEEPRASNSLIAIRNRTGAHDWGSLEPLSRSGNGDPGHDEPGLPPRLGIAILTHSSCAYIRRWLSDRPAGEFEELDGLARFDGLDRGAVLRDPERVAPAHRDLKAAMVLARCQARSAALEAGSLRLPGGAGLLVSFGVGLVSDRVVFGGAYLLGSDVETQFLGLGDDPSSHRVERRGDELLLRDAGDLEVRVARDHRARILGLLAGFDRFDPKGDARVGGTDTPVGLRICLRVHSQAAPVQAVMRLLGSGFLDIRQMIWFSSAELTASKVRRARELLRGFEAHLDRLDPAGLRRLASALL